MIAVLMIFGACVVLLNRSPGVVPLLLPHLRLEAGERVLFDVFCSSGVPGRDVGMGINLLI